MKIMMIVVAICCCLIAGCGDGSEKFVRATNFLPSEECRESISQLRTAMELT